MMIASKTVLTFCKVLTKKMMPAFFCEVSYEIIHNGIVPNEQRWAKPRIKAFSLQTEAATQDTEFDFPV